MNNTINQLIFELTNLASESKRRNLDIKQASEKSLEVLKKFPQSNTTDAVFLKNLSKNPDFITPFLLSCQTRNPKYISISISCFHKLITSKLIPITKLELLLDLFIESTSLAVEIQLKILQCLPFLFQNYSIFINDKNLFKLLSICSTLQNSNSNIVNNTASATLSQLINLVFEKISDEDKTPEIDTSYLVPVDNDQTLNVGLNLFDGQRIFLDLCQLIEHHQPQYLKTNYITESLGLEILESVIKTNKQIFLKHQELAFLLRTKIVPILLRFFSSTSKDFLVMVRLSRLILLLVKEQFEILKLETQVILSLLNHVLTKDSSSPFWKKILALEIYKSILQDFKLVELYFMEFDYADESKGKIFNDFWQNSHDLVEAHKYLLNTGEVLQLPISLKHIKHSSSTNSASASTNSASSNANSPSLQELPPGLFQTKSTTKIQFIDLLDKLDPPQVHETYMLYLVLVLMNLFSEGVYNYVFERSGGALERSGALSGSLENSSTEDNLFITAIVNQNHKILYKTYSVFLFSTLDNDLFNKLIRSYQKFCQLSGIIGLVESRDLYLDLLIRATLNLSGKTGFQYKNSVYSLGESIVGTISSTINQALATAPHQQNSVYSRNINARNVLCFRVCVSLAISLGTVLKEESWRKVFMALQWMDYFVKGASEENSSATVALAPHLTPADISSLDHSVKKLDENINFYSNSVYNEIIKATVSLSNEMFNQMELNGDGNNSNNSNRNKISVPVGSDSTIHPCSYNKTFYISKLKELCMINLKKFLISNSSTDENIWKLIFDHYFDIISNRRHLNYQLRISLSLDFNSIMKFIAQDGFNSQFFKQTELLVLNSLNDFIVKLISSPKSDELLVLNCDLEIQSHVLDNLKQLLDQHGTNFQHWDLVFSIVNTSFHENLVTSKQIEKLKPVINSSFELLKMILDEFLGSLPFNQLKILIDCISNFIGQRVDLNISLNSISYFWLISDYLRGSERRLSASTSETKFRKIKDELELFELVVELNDDYNLLYIYLLYSLSISIRKDPRLQVRNGSIQTFFNIIDSNQTKSAIVLDNMYRIIFVKLLDLDWQQGSETSLLDSYYLTLNEFVKLYVKSISSNFDLEKINYWLGLLNFCKTLVNRINNVELNLKIFKSFQDLIQPFQPNELPQEILELIYNFWTCNEIVYNLGQNNLYQESLTALMELFPKLFQLIQPILTTSMFNQILGILNSCIKYPVLPDFVSNDDLRSTALQEAVYTNLNTLVSCKFSSNGGANSEYDSLLLQELTSIVILPFETRNKILNKFSKLSHTKNLKVPSFISVSHRCIDLLAAQLQKCELNLIDFVKDESILKLYKSLFEPVQLKLKGISIKKDFWIQCMEILMGLNDNIVKVLSQLDDTHSSLTTRFWNLVVKLIEILNLVDFEDTEIENIDVGNLEILYDLVESNLMSEINDLEETKSGLVVNFIEVIFNNSYLFQLNEIDQLILSNYKSITSFKDLPFDKINDNNTDLLISTRLKLRKFNLDKLIQLNISFLNAGNTSNRAIQLLVENFELRICISWRKFINLNEVINKSPLPSIQTSEMLKLLQGYFELIERNRENVYFNGRKQELNGLFLELIKYTYRVKGLDTVVIKILKESQ